MEPARSKKHYVKPYSWDQLRNGEWVKQSIQLRLDEWFPKFFGYHMLKLGGLSCELASCACNIQHQVHLDLENPLHTVIADMYDLPFLEKSIDAVILSHQLDYSNDPHRLLREVDRVLVDDGYLVITGFNPISFTGIQSFFPWRRHYFPWSGRMFTSNRIKDWLGVLNYEVLECERYGVFPLQSYRPLWTWLEGNSRGWMKVFGALYFIVARKRTYPLKLIKPHWKLRRPLSPIRVNYQVKPKPLSKINHSR